MGNTGEQKEIDNKLLEVVEASENGLCLCMCGDSSGFNVIEATSNYIISLIKNDLINRSVINECEE